MSKYFTCEVDADLLEAEGEHLGLCDTGWAVVRVEDERRGWSLARASHFLAVAGSAPVERVDARGAGERGRQHLVGAPAGEVAERRARAPAGRSRS